MARFRRDEASLASLLSRARLADGKTLGAARLLDANLTLEAVAAILVEDGLTTSAIEGERLDLDALRSSVARRLRLPTAGLPSPPRAVDGLIDVLLDVTWQHDAPLSAAQRGHCSNASTVEMLMPGYCKRNGIAAPPAPQAPRCSAIPGRARVAPVPADPG